MLVGLTCVRTLFALAPRPMRSSLSSSSRACCRVIMSEICELQEGSKAVYFGSAQLEANMTIQVFAGEFARNSPASIFGIHNFVDMRLAEPVRTVCDFGEGLNR